MTPAPLQWGHAPSELALNSAGLTPFAFANALRIGSSSPVYVAGLLRREPRIAPWSIDTTPSRAATEPGTAQLFTPPATPAPAARPPTAPPRPPRRRPRPVDHPALPRPGHAGHHHQHAERDVDIDVLQVVG